jgi:hypothetical protein
LENRGNIGNMPVPVGIKIKTDHERPGLLKRGPRQDKTWLVVNKLTLR